MVQVAPSILSADFGNLNRDIQTIADDVDLLHVDVMDGSFVPNISFGEVVIKDIKTTVPMDIHLMIRDPDTYIPLFAKLNPYIITFHYEATDTPANTIKIIRDSGVKVGMAVKPATPFQEIAHLMKDIDMLLVMTVEPGFGGQSFMHDMIDKISQARTYIEKNGLRAHIQVDGGINNETAKLVRAAGADIVVAGSYIFGAKDRKAAIESLKHVEG